MKHLFIIALLFSIFSLTGCLENNEETSNKEKLYHEVVISEVKKDGLVVYEDLKDPTAEYPSYIVKVENRTAVIIDGEQGSLKDLKPNQTVGILLKDGVLDETKEMAAIEIKVFH